VRWVPLTAVTIAVKRLAMMRKTFILSGLMKSSKDVCNLVDKSVERTCRKVNGERILVQKLS
jgi:hypothetical protein